MPIYIALVCLVLVAAVLAAFSELVWLAFRVSPWLGESAGVIVLAAVFWFGHQAWRIMRDVFAGDPNLEPALLVDAERDTAA